MAVPLLPLACAPNERPAVRTGAAPSAEVAVSRWVRPGDPGGHRSADRINAAMAELLEVAPAAGSYVAESDWFERDWKRSYWGSNYPRLAEVKRAYDPTGLFSVHNGVGITV